jgi:hypothetical protein
LAVLPLSPILFIFLIEIIKQKLACKLLIDSCLAVVLDGFQTVVSPPTVCPILGRWGIFYGILLLYGCGQPDSRCGQRAMRSAMLVCRSRIMPPCATPDENPLHATTGLRPDTSTKRSA